MQSKTKNKILKKKNEIIKNKEKSVPTVILQPLINNNFFKHDNCWCNTEQLNTKNPKNNLTTKLNERRLKVPF